MRVSISKSEAVVLSWKRMDCLLWVGSELLPKVEQFKYLLVLLKSEGRLKHKIDRWIGAVAALMRSFYRAIMVKKELSLKAKL